MTKLKLNLAQGVGEILTREELKKVLGGTGGGSGSGTCSGDALGEDAAAKLICSGTCPSISGYQQKCRKAKRFEHKGSVLAEVIGAYCYCA